jgi:gluconolactonase
MVSCGASADVRRHRSSGRACRDSSGRAGNGCRQNRRDDHRRDRRRAAGRYCHAHAGGFEFTEGPAVDASGDIFFTDLPPERIHKWSVAWRTVTLFRERSGRANGLFVGGDGNVVACEGNARRITSTDRRGQVTVIADRFEGKRFNRPNDLWIDPLGGVYFTDPAYGQPAERELDAEGVYYIRPDRQSVIRVAADLNRPNGIVGTSDRTTLYVAELGGRRTWSYRIRSDGTLESRRLVVAKGSDGMTLDAEGHLYLTNLESSAIDIYSPAGDLLESIAVPERPSNVTFGGADRRTLFITAQTSLYAVAMRVAGQQPARGSILVRDRADRLD